MLARSVGFQHLLVSHFATDWFDKSEAPSLFDFYLVERALHHFDEDEGLHRGPEKAIAEFKPIPILGAFYKGETRLAREINLFIKCRYRFPEAALVRRSLVSLDMMRCERHGLNHF